MIRLFFSLIATVIFLSCQSRKVQIISTTPELPWVENSIDIRSQSDSIVNFEIETSDKAQLIDGFGACLNELGWDALTALDENIKQSILQDFFEPGKGFGLNICRLPIGANDYAREWYSLNDSVNDFDMKYFNVEHDKKTLIPYIKSALQYNPNLKFWGSPWSPPVWMKQNHHYACRTAYPGTEAKYLNGLTLEQEGREGINQFIMDSQYLSAYARYFVRYIRAYEGEGINVYAVHVQNEFNSCQPFPSCTWKASGLAEFIGKYLGPEFEHEKLSTEIWLGTIERKNVALIDTVVNDACASKYLTGLGFQWDGKGAIGEAAQKFPALKLMQTESECGNGANDQSAAEHTWDLIKHYFNNGANAYMYWNLILEKEGMSRWGWKQNALISVDTINKTIVYNPEYYLFKHLCYAVKPGAYHLLVKGDNSDVLAFLNPDQSIVLILVNRKDEAKDLNFTIDNKSYHLSIKAKSFNTLIL